MYAIALSVAACLRGGTRVDVAWNLDPDRAPTFDPTDAVAITPGGGRLGSLFGGALDSRLLELSLIEANKGRVVSCELDDIEAVALDVQPGTVLRIAFAPAEALPGPMWDLLLQRAAVGVVADLDGDRFTEFRLSEPSGSTMFGVEQDRLTGCWVPTPSLVVFGQGPIAGALAGAAGFLGWNVQQVGGADHAVGIAATLSTIDGLVVFGHDTEAVGRVLQAGLGSDVGYIGSIGPNALQQDRGDWLAYRGVTDIGRISGPAGIPVGARTPEEIAVSVVCEMLGARNEPGH